jgi:mannose-1-phosphate guanylyltransferase
MPGWSDVGSWSALWETSDRDGDGNVLQGRVISQGSRNCYPPQRTPFGGGAWR